MKNDNLIIGGELFDMLESLSHGEKNIVRIPINHPVSVYKIDGPVDPIYPQIEYEEYELSHLPDGKRAWRKK